MNRNFQEVNSILMSLPRSHRRYCVSTGWCGCIGCISHILTVEEFEEWKVHYWLIARIWEILKTVEGASPNDVR